MSLICCYGSANTVEQIAALSEELFICLIQQEKEMLFESRDEAVEIIQTVLNIKRNPDPYNYVKNIQKNFDYSLIMYSDEYWRVVPPPE